MRVGLRKIARRAAASKAQAARQVDKAAEIYAGANEVQRALIDDQALYLSGLCPRRAGKTYGATSKALHLGEAKPGARILIISQTLKATVENYWSGAPGGLWFQNARYDLGLKFNTTAHTWTHPNGSRGMLAGAETKADIERLRGGPAEADLVIIDECKSFAPGLLEDLIRNVIEPGLMTRNGQLLLIGTPGSLPLGPFYHATCLRARVPAPTESEPDAVRPTCIPYDERENPGPAYRNVGPDEFEDLYSLHSWHIQHNTAAPGQWARALRIKRQNGWADDHPTWRREFLGEWVSDESDLVYQFAHMRAQNKCLWTPGDSGVTGLPERDGPWHLLLGLDLGFVDDCALVLVAYSEQLRELRVVYDYKAPGMDAQTFAEEVLGVIDRYGQPEMIVADVNQGGSKMIVEMLNQRYGLAIQPAQKREKQDHIELMNGDFLADRIKVIPSSDLDHELCGLQWDLSANSKTILARTGRLREDPKCPNHLCDALLYIWRFSYHYYSSPHTQAPEKGTDAWWKVEEERAIQRAVSRRRGLTSAPGAHLGRDRTALGDTLWTLR